MTGPKADDPLPPDDRRYRRDIGIVLTLLAMVVVAVLAAMLHALMR